MINRHQIEAIATATADRLRRRGPAAERNELITEVERAILTALIADRRPPAHLKIPTSTARARRIAIN